MTEKCDGPGRIFQSGKRLDKKKKKKSNDPKKKSCAQEKKKGHGE